MAHLETLLNDLANLDAQHDLEAMRRLREQIVSEHPESEAAVEALYKIGLDLLFRERQLEPAMEKFEEAVKRKHAFWSAAARTSLGLCFYHLKREQKALLELRKVAYAEEPSAHSVTALAFIENILEAEGKDDEARRARKDRIMQLERLIERHREREQDAERGFYMYTLGLALRDQQEEGRARAVLEQAKALGPDALGADLFRSVVDALNE